MNLYQRLLQVSSGAVLALCAMAAGAQEYPSKPIRLIVATAVGGGPDLIARSMTPPMAAMLGQPFTVDNIPGAGGVVGVRTLIKSPPDGHTLLFTDNGKWAIAPTLQPSVYDPVKELAPIGLAVTNVTAIVVGESFPAKNISEFIAAVKAKPGFYPYGSSGNGSLHHIAMEAFKNAHGLDMIHVPFKGAAQSSAALMGGQIASIIAGPAALQAQFKSGQARMLAVTSKRRSKHFPDVPSMAEPGNTDLDFRGDLGYLAPAGTPRPIIDRLAGVIAKTMLLPEVISRVESIGSEPLVTGPDELAQIIRADVARYARAVKQAGIKVD